MSSAAAPAAAAAPKTYSKKVLDALSALYHRVAEQIGEPAEAADRLLAALGHGFTLGSAPPAKAPNRKAAAAKEAADAKKAAAKEAAELAARAEEAALARDAARLETARDLSGGYEAPATGSASRKRRAD